MYDDSRASEQSDFQTIVNAFTQGLRELPTDNVARVKNFLAEYLGSPQHPVPFGGRARDFAYLDNWLADTQAPPYLLLAAPAGRGKSALLLHWCRQLFARSNLAVAYFPVSIRFRTNLAGVVFPSLVALLARLHNEKIPADPNLPEEVWRGLFAEYSARPLPDGRPLVLVLDGVDEAADWAAGPDLFPLEPPSGLHIVLSARYLANDQDADAWLKRLGWTRPGLARTLELYPLDRTGVASVLHQMGFPLDLLGERVNIISELYRLSEGDPLLVRLYVDDLWERGEAAVHLQPEDLRSIRPGLAGYFERWWRDQRLLWSKEAPQREVAAQIILNLLAGALGPLSKEDLLSLAPGEASFRSSHLEQHLAPLARFVTGDGIHQGYVFSHPRLGNYFLEERLSEPERQEVERRFLAWGERTLAALNAGTLPPEKASAYIVQYYGAHLERAQADVPTLLSLVSDGWRRAWEKLDRANAGFLGDVERAWRAAERADAAATSTDSAAPYLGDELRCLLSQVSINSLTSNISSRLMLAAVKTGIWTPAQGLANIRLISDLLPRARELVGLAPFVQEPLRSDILQEALDTIAAIKDEYARLDALVALAPDLSEELLWQVLDHLPSIEDEADRAGVLAELAPTLAPYPNLFERALRIVQEMGENEYRALALEGLAPYCFADQHGRVLHLVKSCEEERDRFPVLMALIPHLAPDLLQDVLQEARAMQDGLSRLRLLTALVAYLDNPLRAEVVQEVLAMEGEIEDREYRIEVLIKLAPFLSLDELQPALQEVQQIWDEGQRSRALCDLLPHIPAELLPQLQQITLAMHSDEFRVKTLLQLLPRLSPELIEPLLDTASAIWDEGLRVELLAQLAPHIPETQLSHLVEIASTIKDQGYRVWLLAELEASLVGKRESTYADMLAVFLTIPNKEQLQTLLAIAPRLSEEALSKLLNTFLPELFGFMWSVRSEEARTDTLTKLGGRLPEDWLSTAIRETRSLVNEHHQVQALTALAPRIHGSLLSEALAVVQAMKEREKRAQVLEALVSSLPDEHKGERVQEMLQVLQIIKDEAERSHLVAACASHLPSLLPASMAHTMIEAARRMRDEENQARVLKAIIPYLPDSTLENVLSITHVMRIEAEKASLLEVLSRHIPEPLYPRLLSMVRRLPSERWHARVLTIVIAHAPTDIVAGMVEMARDGNEQPEVLRALVTYAPEGYFQQSWDAIQQIPHGGRRALVMGALVLRMPSDFFPRFWQALQEIDSEPWLLAALGTMAPHLQPSLFKQLWVALRDLPDKEKRLRMQARLAPHVPEDAFSLVWEDLQTISDETVRLSFLQTLAWRVPADFFPQMFAAVQAISPHVDDRVRTLILKRLIPHVPADLFPVAFKTIQSFWQEDELHALLLIDLFPHVPEQFFPHVWETVQTVRNPRLQARLLEEMSLHVPGSLLPDFWTFVRSLEDKEAHTRVVSTLLPALLHEGLVDAPEMIRELPYGDLHVKVLEELAPQLSAKQCEEIIEAALPPQLETRLAEVLAQPIWERKWQRRMLAVLLPSLSEEKQSLYLAALLKAIPALKADDDPAWLLTKLAPHIPEAFLPAMLDTLLSPTSGLPRTQVWKALLPSLSRNGWAIVLERVLARTLKTADAGFALQMLQAADSLLPSVPQSQLYPLLREVLHLIAQRERRDALPDLSLLAPTIQALGGKEAISTMLGSSLEVGCWWP